MVFYTHKRSHMGSNNTGAKKDADILFATMMASNWRTQIISLRTESTT